MNMHNPPHPGEILKEMYLEPLELTVTETAKALDITRQTLSDLVNGKSSISIYMAIRLSKAFMTSPEMWINLQFQYDLWNAKRKFVKRFQKVRCLVGDKCYDAASA